jgi:hypothetical protein
MDYELGVSILCDQHERANRPTPEHPSDVSAETSTVMAV